MGGGKQAARADLLRRPWRSGLSRLAARPPLPAPTPRGSCSHAPSRAGVAQRAPSFADNPKANTVTVKRERPVPPEARAATSKPSPRPVQVSRPRRAALLRHRGRSSPSGRPIPQPLALSVQDGGADGQAAPQARPCCACSSPPGRAPTSASITGARTFLPGEKVVAGPTERAIFPVYGVFEKSRRLAQFKGSRWRVSVPDGVELWVRHGPGYRQDRAVRDTFDLGRSRRASSCGPATSGSSSSRRWASAA